MNWVQRLFLRGPESECKSCALLQTSLEYERARFAELQDTMISLLKPVPIIREGVNPTPKPISTAGKLWSRRRHELERTDAAAARLKATSPVIAKPDSEIKADEKPTVTPNPTPMTIDQLELELGVVDSDNVDRKEPQEVH